MAILIALIVTIGKIPIIGAVAKATNIITMIIVVIPVLVIVMLINIAS